MITPTTTARNIQRLKTTHATVFVADPPGPGPRVADKLAVKLPNVRGDRRQRKVIIQYAINCNLSHKILGNE